MFFKEDLIYSSVIQGIIEMHSGKQASCPHVASGGLHTLGCVFFLTAFQLSSGSYPCAGCPTQSWELMKARSHHSMAPKQQPYISAFLTDIQLRHVLQYAE